MCSLFQKAAALALLVTLGACGGSSSDTAPEPGMGKMTLLITDAETDRFDEILVTIDEVVLIPAGNDGQQQVLRDEAVTVNLRDLEDFSEFLASEDVEAGTYEKLRLVVDSIELNDLDENGNILENRIVDMPSGKVDLNPRQAFVVNDGDESVVMIDFDADNSFKVVETGAGGLKFRPVVFIQIIGDGDDESPGRLIRQHGQVTSLDMEGSRFELCNLEMTSAEDSGLPGDDECPDVIFDGGTSVFTDGTSPATSEDLVENSEVTVIGHVDNGPDGLQITAIIIVIGALDSVEEITGTVATTVSAENTFDLTTEADDGTEEVITVTLQTDARIFERQGGTILTASDLEVGAMVRAFGTGDAGAFTAIAVSVIDDDSSTLPEQVAGSISSIDGDTLSVSEEDNGVVTEVCVQLQEDTMIQISTDGELVEEGTVADLEVGVDVEVEGPADAEGCIMAELIIIEGAEEDQA